MSKFYPTFADKFDAKFFHPDELLDLFLECTVDGLAIFDMENRLIRVNRMLSTIFGYTEEEFIGKRVEEFPHTKEVLEIFRQVKSGKAFTDLVTQRYHKNGKLLDIAVSYSPFQNRNKEIIAIIAIFRDVTKHLNVERELKRTRELYKLITENTTDMIKVFTKDKKVVYASPSYEKVLGIHPREFVGKDLNTFLFPEEIEMYEKNIKKLLDTGEPQLFQKKILTAQNEPIYAEFNVSPVYNERNEIEAYVTVGRNITDRIKNDEALRNLDRLSIIGQLAAGVAHEIRNPLTSLKGFSKLLHTTDDKEKQENYLSIITEELDRIDSIVNEFMSLAKPQAVQFERGSLISILDSTVRVLMPQAAMNNIKITFDDFEGDIELFCCSHQLKQVFVNFIKNAIESMPKGGHIHIRVKKAESKKVVIYFTDEGTGIETKRLKYLGTPFYTTKDKGIGLGLTISNKILQEHNGIMKIESRVGEGTTVKVELEYI